MSWWESSSGMKFREKVRIGASIYYKRNLTGGKVSPQEILSFIFLTTGINPDVVEKWRHGGNPSIVNIEKILLECSTVRNILEEIINGLRYYKKMEKKGKPNPTETVKLKAIVGEYNVDRQKYWVRCYNGNTFIFGDCISKYAYAPKFINTPGFRRRVMEVLGHNNFEIEFDAVLSIPERAR